MFVLPPLMNVLPASWNNAASPYLPLAAGEAIMSTSPGNHLSPWVGFALFCGYAATALGIAAVLLVRRDT
jgi:ABC-2 type transport system permease protein